MDEKYQRFVNEVEFSRQLLGIGLTSLRKASFADQGVYYQALSSISLGLERLMKLCLILDDFNRTGNYTSRDQLRDYGHNLFKLFNLIHSRADKEIPLKEYHLKALQLLTTFAKSSRYSNIDFITSDADTDPIKEWHNEIDKRIYNDVLNEKQRERINKKCDEYRVVADSLPIHVMGFYDENRNEINSGGELHYLILRSEMLAGYRVLLVIQIIEAIYKIFKSHTRNPRDQHYCYLELSRFFATIIYGSDRDKINRKDFTRMD